MPKILSCVNLKGGVGKTAIAVNFAAYCGMQQFRTLLIDVDPQTNATFSCIELDKWESHAKKKGTLADLFGMRAHARAEKSKRDAQDVILKDVFEGVDLIPSHLDLFTMDLDLASATSRETKLRKAIRPVEEDYDIIVCDCPPNLAMPTQNALAMSSHYIVPISPDYLSGIGVGLLIKRVEEFRQDMELDLKLAGIIISRVGRPATHRSETVAAIRKKFKKKVLSATITERVEVSKAAAEKKPIYLMKNQQAAREFETISQEILDRIGGI